MGMSINEARQHDRFGLRARRERAGLDREQLAELANTSSSTVRAIELGLRATYGIAKVEAALTKLEGSSA